MLACLCPLKFAAEESINTLHFASMALRIKSVPVMMIDPQVGKHTSTPTAQSPLCNSHHAASAASSCCWVHKQHSSTSDLQEC
jgi:hypothetical protein